MNLVLFEPAELHRPLDATDPRARHIRDVLRRQPGDTFDAGVIDGPRGKARLDALEPGRLILSFTWGAATPALDPITLVVGLPRPQTARRILREATSLGVAAMHFCLCERTEPGYARSELWSTSEWRRHLIAGAEQAFDTRLPSVSWEQTLSNTLESIPRSTAHRLALDNYESPRRLTGPGPGGSLQLALAIGPERGWGADDRQRLRAAGFEFVHLGPRVLRTETALIAALALLKANAGSRPSGTAS